VAGIFGRGTRCSGSHVLGSGRYPIPSHSPRTLSPKDVFKTLWNHAFYTDDWGAYERHLEPENHSVGKENTQKIERKNLTLRTRIKRLVRKTICFSKKILMHDMIIGLFINRYEFACANAA
jgi:IS1 family transposase